MQACSPYTAPSRRGGALSPPVFPLPSHHSSPYGDHRAPTEGRPYKKPTGRGRASVQACSPYTAPSRRGGALSPPVFLLPSDQASPYGNPGARRGAPLRETAPSSRGRSSCPFHTFLSSSSPTICLILATTSKISVGGSSFTTSCVLLSITCTCIRPLSSWSTKLRR